MSIKVMSEVWECAPLVGTDLLVLMALADMANDDRRECWPGLKNLAHKARISIRQVSNVLGDLELQGIIAISARMTEQGGNTSNLYRVNEVDQWAVLTIYEDDNTPMNHRTSPYGTVEHPPIEPQNIPPNTFPRVKVHTNPLRNPNKNKSAGAPPSTKFPKSIRSYTTAHIQAYQEQHQQEVPVLIKAWAGDMFGALTEFTNKVAQQYIETHIELKRLHIPNTEYAAIATHTKKCEDWKKFIAVTDMLLHLNDYHARPEPTAPNFTGRTPEQEKAKRAHDWEEMFGAKRKR